MLADHNKIPVPPADATPIWRYMDFSKFVSMLHTESLFFCRPECFDDRWEGFDPFLYALPPLRDSSDDNSEDKIPSGPAFREAVFGHAFVNCWHMNPVESAAMWKQYTQTDDAIAVCSTIGKLQNAADAAKERIFIGAVEYIDPSNYAKIVLDGPVQNLIRPFFFKRLSFQHEQELRALIWADSKINSDDSDGAPSGVYVAMNIESLIDNIILAPGCKSWFVELVRGITGKYGLDENLVSPSAFDEEPPWN